MKQFIAERQRAKANDREAPIYWLDEVHLLDLLSTGVINYHIDNTEVSQLKESQSEGMH